MFLVRLVVTVVWTSFVRVGEMTGLNRACLLSGLFDMTAEICLVSCVRKVLRSLCRIKMWALPE